MNGSERRDFVREHRTCVFGFARKQHGPSLSVVYYVMDGDDLLVSTMDRRAKARAIRRDPRMSLCILDENWPITYLTLYGTASIEPDRNAELLKRICEVMAEGPIPESKRTELVEMAEREHRVMVRVTPYATFESPPRHVYRPDDIDDLTHGYGTTLPWHAD